MSLNKTQKIWVLFAMSLCTALVFLESTIFPIALPTVQKDIHMNQESLYWTINSYLLVLACLIYAGGKLSDYFGQKTIFILGTTIFAFASLLGIFSSHAAFLILSRSVQGLGAAFMIPSSSSITLTVLDKKERGKGIGFLVAISSVFLSLGPFLGGFFSQYASWRYIFAINIPIALVILLVTYSYVPRFEKVKSYFDLKEFFVYFGCLTFLTMILMELKTYSVISKPVLIHSIFFLVFAFLFVKDLIKNKSHFFDYQIFKYPLFLGGNFIIFIAQFLVMMMVFWSLFFQKILNYSPVESGVMILFATLPIIFCAPLSGFFSDRFGSKWLTAGGFALVAFSFLWLILFPLSTGSYISLYGLTFFGSGISIIMTPASTALFSQIPFNKRGSAVGLYLTLKNIASTFSVAILGGVVSLIIHRKFQYLMQDKLNLKTDDYRDLVLMFLQEHNLREFFPAFSQEMIDKISQAICFSAQEAFGWIHVLCFLLSVLGVFVSLLTFKTKKTNKNNLII